MRRCLLSTAALLGLVLTLAGSASGAARLYVPAYGVGPPEPIGGFARAADGSLAPIAGSPFAGGPVSGPPSGLIALAFAPEGSRAVGGYLFNGGAQGMSVAADGTVVLAGAAVLSPSVTGLAISPDGRFAYTPTRDFMAVQGVGILGYSLGASGALSPLPGSPFGGAVDDVGDIAITPDGRFLYAIRAGQLDAYAIGAGGGLTALAPGPGVLARTLQVSPEGRFLFVAIESPSDGVASYSIAADGSLSPNGPPALTGDVSLDYFAVAPDGRHVYMPDSNLDAIVTASVAADGTLTTGAATPVENAQSAAVSPDGRFLYFFFQPGGVNSLGVASLGADGTPTVLPSVVPWDSGEPERLLLQPAPAPIAQASAEPALPGAESSFDARPSTRAARFDWDFGDGTTLPDGGPTPKHRYAKAGVYDVRLTVSDEQGCAARQIYTGQSTTCPGGVAATRTLTLDTLPALGVVTMTRRRFAVAPAPRTRGRVVKPKGVKRGTRLRFTLSEKAKVRFTVERRLQGRKVGSRCRPPTRGNAMRKRCVRFKRVGAFAHQGKAGRNARKFAGRLRGRRLAAGRYRAVAVATDSAGGRSVVRRRAFRVVGG